MAAKSSNTITQNVDGLLADLHDALLTKTLTQCPIAKDSRYEDHGAIQKLSKDNTYPWRRFLDLLCGLCWVHKHGGSITACAAQDCGQKARVWVATNDPRMLQSAVNHMKCLHRFLLGAAKGSQDLEVLRPFAEAIHHVSVKQATERIASYHRDLQLDLETLEGHLDGLNDNEKAVCSSLRTIVPGARINKLSPEQSLHVVSAMEAFAVSPEYAELTRIAQEKGGIWKVLRHMVGRLCFWKTAASFLVLHAREFGRVIETAEFFAIPQLAPTSPKAISIESTVKRAFQRVFGKEHPIAQYAGEKLAYAQRLLDQLVKKEQIPTIHAETAIAHHFTINNLPFIYNDPYIGCTKPSCYPCSLYMEALPRIYKTQLFVQRLSHGNSWLRWELPRGANDDKREAAILRLMAAAVKSNVETDVKGKRYGGRKAFESTTGMSGQVEG